MSCSTDGSGNVFMAGTTDFNTTPSVIATVGSHQSTPGGGTFTDAFLVKFNAAGVRQWGTFYGGSNDDFGFSCANDAAGNIYLCGDTYSSNGTTIATLGSHQSIFGGVHDGFFVKFNTLGTRQWGTYYGGNSSDYTNACSINNSTGDISS